MTIVAFIIVLGILVLVHEWGHFQVARWCGVRVETFSIGFGPQLASIERGDTTYRIAAIPLGGYVKMAGDEPGDEHASDPDGYYAQPIRKRAAIVLAGPLMNIIFAFAVAPLMYLVGVPESVHLNQPATIGWVEGTDYSEKLLTGDKVVAVDDKPIATWRELQNALAISQGQIQLTVQRDGIQRDEKLEVPSPGILLQHILPPMDTTVEKVLPDSAAADAGLQSGDQIIAINARSINHWMAIRHALSAVTAGQSVTVAVDRGGRMIEKQLTPKAATDGRLLLGISRRDQMQMRQYGLSEAIAMGTGRVIEMFDLTFQVLGRLFTGKLGMDALGGPIMIAQGAGDAAAQGLGSLLTFMIFISIQLGVLNLLPIPVLDGGHLTLMLIEGAVGRRLPDKVIAAMQYTGFALLMCLILYVTRNDIMRIWGNSIQRFLDGF